MWTWRRHKNITDQVTWTYSVVIIIIATQQVTKSKLLSQENYVYIIDNTKYEMQFKNKRELYFPTDVRPTPLQSLLFWEFQLAWRTFWGFGSTAGCLYKLRKCFFAPNQKGVVTLPATNIIKTQKRLQWQFKSALTQWMTRHKAGLTHTDFIRCFSPSSRLL